MVFSAVPVYKEGKKKPGESKYRLREACNLTNWCDCVFLMLLCGFDDLKNAKWDTSRPLSASCSCSACEPSWHWELLPSEGAARISWAASADRKLQRSPVKGVGWAGKSQLLENQAAGAWQAQGTLPVPPSGPCPW